MKKYYSLIFALALAFILSLSPAAAETDASEIVSAPESGVYNITNRASGLTLNAFDFAFADGGYAYVDNSSGSSGENILLLRQSDGSYLIYPQSETGKYAFTVVNDAAAERISKSEAVTSGSYFRMSGDDVSGYTIATAGGYALGTSDGAQLYRKTLVIAEPSSGADTQKWDMEPVEITSLKLKTVSDSVKVNSVSAVYAIVKPSYMKKFIEWSSSDESIVMMDDDGTFCALAEGTVTVTAKIGDFSQSIDVTVVDKDAFTWYSQHMTTGGGWHAADLSNVYFYSGGHKRYIINGFNKNIDWMDQGCYITSIAMVLHNLGARYKNGYDFRFDAEGSLEIDPYVASLINSNNYGLTASRGTLYGDPIAVYINAIASRVTVYGQPVVAKRYSGVTKKALKEMLDKHPEGVIVGMRMPNESHYIVVTDCLNPYADPSQYRFKIYDSAGLRRSQGDNVAFEKSISYTTIGYRYSSMVTMTVFDFVPEGE